ARGLRRPHCDWPEPLSRQRFFECNWRNSGALGLGPAPRPLGPRPRDVTRCRRAPSAEAASVSAPSGSLLGTRAARERERAGWAGVTHVAVCPAPRPDAARGRGHAGVRAIGEGEAARSSVGRGVTRAAVPLGAGHGGRALGLFVRHLAAEPRRVAAGRALHPARGEGAHWPVRLCPGRQGSHGRGSIPEFFHIMKRKFTNKEWETIRSFKDEWTQLDMFYRNWALKESFIKAIGVGLGFELQRLEFDISPLNLDIGQVYKETRLFLDGEEEKEWAFEVPPQDDSKPTQRQFTILTFNDLISSAVPMTPEDPSFWDCFCFTEEIPIRNGTKS
uniref:L-aminoadipate-semialdehyde dehydrogenase-phosphopantetheinyl transferase n=1 Tax=Canis lupus familiaris TaxID=9615 RepID=A0A8C0SNC9_CANLF